MAKRYQLEDGSNGWVVELCEPEDDGICHKAIFFGPDAERQAADFFHAEYGDHAILLRRSA